MIICLVDDLMCSRVLQVVVAETFDKIVNDPTKDVLIDFCVSSSEHCQHLATVYEELAFKVCLCCLILCI